MTTVLVTLAVVLAIALVCGGLLTLAQRRYADDSDAAVESINAVLPQTQCAQCGYPGCRPYAQAIVDGEAINRCPPGGDRTIAILADLLGREPLPLDDDLEAIEAPTVVRIREPECIGCKLCIEACPVDAIIGAPRLMHTVIEAECTGCNLCLPVCPVDCIDIVDLDIAPPPELPLIAEPCIHCGDCVPVCPRDLSPEQLLQHSQEAIVPAGLSLEACIECRLCDKACPVDIPLTETFRVMKHLGAERERDTERAIQLETRFEQREQRKQAASTSVRKRPGNVQALLDSIGDDP